MLQVHDVLENSHLFSKVCVIELCLDIRGELRLGKTLDNTDHVPSSWPSGGVACPEALQDVSRT